ncbi:MAG: toll/interleukin-1 receptor domain-containing protein [Alistipes sp.]|nr:toll/interleukin-1 receptor domain-containing protein [Alistipes sp.]
MSYQAFISYARADYQKGKEGLVSQVKKQLEEYGDDRLNVWFDESSIESSKDFVESIAKAIDESHIFVVVLTENSCNSDWVFRELCYAVDKRMPIVPIKAIEEFPQKIKLILGATEHIDHFATPSVTLQRFKSTVDSLLGQLELEDSRNAEIIRLRKERDALESIIKNYEEYLVKLKAEVDEKTLSLKALEWELTMRVKTVELITNEVTSKSERLHKVISALEGGSKGQDEVAKDEVIAPAEAVTPAREDKQEPATTEEATPAPAPEPAPTSTPASEESTPAESPAPAPAAEESKGESPQKAMSALMAHMKFLKPTPKEEAPKSEGGGE